MEQIKAQFSPFLNVVIFGQDREEKLIKLKCRLNPNSITSCHEAFIDIDGQDEPLRVTRVICGAVYNVDLPIKEFDLFMQNIERGISFEENN